MENSLNFGLAGAKVAGALFLLLGLIVLGFFLLKRFGPKAGLQFFSEKEFKLLGQFSLGPKKKLVLVRFLNKILLLAVTDKEISLIAETQADHAREDKQFSQELYKCADQNPDPSIADPPKQSS